MHGTDITYKQVGSQEKKKNGQNGKLVQDENVNAKAKDMAKPQHFYWDSYQGKAQTSTETIFGRKSQVMSHGKAKSVLGLWKKGSMVERKTNEQEDFTEEIPKKIFWKPSEIEAK